MRYLFGEWTTSETPLTLDQIKDITDRAQTQSPAMAAYPLDRIFDVLERLCHLWSDESYEGRVTALQLLPGATGFSREMTALALNELPKLLDPKGLERKLQTELRSVPPVGEESYDTKTGTGLSWQPIGTVLHVLAGNVFLGGPGSLLEGLITKNVNILKMSSGERVFMPLFVRSLQDVDTDGVISRSIALIDYSSSRTDLIKHLTQSVDGVVVWGGEHAVKAYRETLGVHTRLISFGPKLSFGLVTAAGYETADRDELVQRLARDISIWDQNACTAPQLVYVEGEANAVDLAGRLSDALERVTAEIPPGPADLQTAIEIRKLRTVAEISEALGHGRLFESAQGLDHTVIVSADPVIEASPLHRTIRIVPLAKIQTAIDEAKKLKGFIQTVGLEAAAIEQASLVRELTRAGAVRLVAIGSMAGGEIDDPHDGQYDLAQLVNFVFNRLKKPTGLGSPIDLYSPEQFKERLDSRLRRLLSHARHAPLYAERLKELDIQSVESLPCLPVLTRQDLDANMPPNGCGLQTLTPVGGYVSRSGGSTGEPKYSIYDGRDWENMISAAVPMFGALGLKRGDRVANCFMAGDLYGSFVSFDHINVRMGVLNFAFAGNVKPEFFAQTQAKLGFNVVMGVPAFIMPLLREAKRLETALRLEKVIYAGAPMSEADRAWLKDILGVSRIASVIGANDGGQLAYQCEHQSGRFHHLVDDFNYVEIVDESGATVDDGESGRILITSLMKFAYPLIRYDIGDRGRIVPHTCLCGSRRRVIEYLGRADNVVSAGLMNADYADFVAAVRGQPVNELQLRVSVENGTDKIEVLFETDSRDPNLASVLLNLMTQKLGQLERRLAEKALLFNVRTVPLGTLPRNPRTGKLKQVIDERF